MIARSVSRFTLVVRNGNHWANLIPSSVHYPDKNLMRRTRGNGKVELAKIVSAAFAYRIGLIAPLIAQLHMHTSHRRPLPVEHTAHNILPRTVAIMRDRLGQLIILTSCRSCATDRSNLDSATAGHLAWLRIASRRQIDQDAQPCMIGLRRKR